MNNLCLFKIFKSTVNYNKDSFNSLIIILKYVKWLNKCDLAMYIINV